MTQAAHLEQHQQRDLSEIKAQLKAMSEMVLTALAEAQRSLERRDRRAAYAVILADNRVDAQQVALDHLCQVFLVRHMPAGSVLRFIFATIKVVAELERIGDYAEAIAHRTIALSAAPALPHMEGIQALGELSRRLLRDAVDAFLSGDTESAEKVMNDEGITDEMNQAIFEALAREGEGDASLPTRFAMLNVLNRVERVADRASNIAEHALYATRGEIVSHGPRGGHKIILLSVRDAFLGPLVEALANARAPLSVSFTSCGLDPAPAFDPKMLELLASRGLSLNRARPRGIEEAGPRDTWSVVVTLTREADERCPELPYRTVALAWDLPDPAEGSLADRRRLEAVLAEIEARLHDLIGALNPTLSDKKESS